MLIDDVPFCSSMIQFKPRQMNHRTDLIKAPVPQNALIGNLWDLSPVHFFLGGDSVGVIWV